VEEPLEGEVVEAESPREGTLAWLALQPTVEVDGLGLIPACHRLPADCTLYLGDDDGRCRVIHSTGERCRATRTHSYGLCMPHAGGGARDHAAMGALGAAQRARLRTARLTLGLGSRTAADPRQVLRVAALARSQEIADAVLSPLDDDDLGSVTRQRTALAVLDAAFPQQQVTVTVDVPQDEAGVAGLSWQDMQALAAQLLEGDTTETQSLNPA